MSGVQQIEVRQEDADQRLDRWFKRHFPALGHGRLEKLLRTGQIRLDGKRAKAADRIEAGQVVRVPPLGEATERPKQPQQRRASAADDRWAKTLQKAVLYKDDDVLVIDKPAGLAVQGGTSLSTSVDDLLDALQFDAKERPRLVHRLDRDTSGVLALARNAKAAQRLTESFRHKDARKVYWAVVVGVPEVRGGRIDAPLQKAGGKGAERVHVDEEGKRAVTEFAVIERAGKKAAWLALMPVTGRTHQLRAHCVALGTPILGDGKYAGAAAFLAKENLARQLHLHARRLRIPHPTGKGWIDVTAPLPEHMRKTWSFFGFAAKPEKDPFGERNT
ncbi:RluA family pseudouridine synthase [Dongia deserti]|uniref:RluA family pseudouridine synthase n=1 Tax=Dongia deserti TaxID=2268030 RepID=UPI000E6527C7|nr:RluA family pseudouridine synthase [Dongia deserti]